MQDICTSIIFVSLGYEYVDVKVHTNHPLEESKHLAETFSMVEYI